MYYVYLLRSLSDSTQRYVGFTTRAPEVRLAEHNAGHSIHTNKFKPWKIIGHFAFDQQCKAENFERYLKHGSGHAFANRHFGKSTLRSFSEAGPPPPLPQPETSGLPTH